MATEQQLELLNDAHQTLLRSRHSGSDNTAMANIADAAKVIRASNFLLDACFAAGMPLDFADHEAWAAERVTRWLVAA